MPVQIASADPIEVSGSVDLTLVRVRFQHDDDVAIVISRLGPKVTAVFQTRPYRNARLVDSVTLNYAVTGIDAQRVFLNIAIDLNLPLLRVSELIVPMKGECVIVVSIVRITLPIARQTNRVRRFFETAVANQFRVQSSFNA